MDLYELVRGPLAWIALLVFILGSLFRILSMLIEAKRDKVVYPYMSAKYGLRSILHWILPFGSRNMRMQPAMTVVSFLFHICLMVTPLFLLAHIVLWYESWSVQWWTLPEPIADGMTLVVIVSCLFFLVRRLLASEVKHVTSGSDILILGVVLLPFVSGFMAYHHWGPYKPLLVLHILAGEIMLMAIPFTRLSHMLFFWFTRSYMGSEFGSVRNAKDW